MLAALLNVVLYIAGAALCLFALFGFWRGLSLPPHREEHRPTESMHGWYRSRD